MIPALLATHRKIERLIVRYNAIRRRIRLSPKSFRKALIDKAEHAKYDISIETSECETVEEEHVGADSDKCIHNS